MPDEPLYRLTLRALPATVPAVVRLRRLLKMAGRAFGFKAIEVEELPVEEKRAGHKPAPPRLTPPTIAAPSVPGGAS